MSPWHAIFGGGEDPSQGRRDVQDVECVPGDELTDRLLARGVLVGYLDVCLVSAAEQAHARGIPSGCAKLLKQRIAERDVFGRPFFPRFLNLQGREGEQAIRLWHG